MLTKTGVNSTRSQKCGPTVREGVKAGKAFKKVVKCAVCNAKLEKSCSNEMVCEISTLKCPRCGTDVC